MTGEETRTSYSTLELTRMDDEDLAALRSKGVTEATWARVGIERRVREAVARAYAARSK